MSQRQAMIDAGFDLDPMEETDRISLAERAAKTGAREVALILLFIWGIATFVLLLPGRSSLVANYDGMYIAMTTNVFLFALGAFALKTYSGVQDQRNQTMVTMTVARNPRLDPTGDVPGAG